MKDPYSFIPIINRWVISIGCLLVPIFFLPLTIDVYEFPKSILIICFTLLLLILWSADLLVHKKFVLIVTPLTTFLFLFTLAFVLSWAVVSPNKIQSLLSPGSVGTIGTLFLFYLLTTVALENDKKLGKWISLSLVSAGVLISWVNMTVMSRILSTTSLPALFRDPNFTLVGGPLGAMMVGIVVTILASAPLLSRIFSRKKEVDIEATHAHVSVHTLAPYWQSGDLATKDKPSWNQTDTFFTLAALIIAIGVGISIFQLTTTAKPILLPVQAGWTILVEGLKTAKSGLFGVGPGNFVAAYTQWKPVSINASPLWNLRFSVSTNYFFQLASEVGMLGFLSYTFLAVTVIKLFFKDKNEIGAQTKFWLLGLLTIIILELLLPTSMTLLFITVVLCALVSSNLPNRYIVSERSVIFSFVACIAVLVIVSVSIFFGGKIVMAEIAFNDAVTAVQKNEAEKAYNKNIEALTLNPYNDLYHITYAQTNLALAQSLIRQEKIDDTIRSNISSFIQQAIREAKAAVSINPAKAANWENLALIYRNIINIADGADTWTIQMYQQSIALDPANPLLRLNLGGVFYSVARYDQAIEQFRIAIALKNDYANGFYNLSAAYRDKGDLPGALSAMQEVVKLVPADNPDFDRARRELEDLEKKVGTTPPPTSESGDLLTKPATPSSKLKPPLTLPFETAPGAEKATPSAKTN